MQKLLWSLLLASILTICFGIPNERCFTGFKPQGIYVSSTTGDDTNNGLSPQCPVKTIKKAKSLGDTILLKAGDYFFEGELKITKTYLSRYGEGSNPTICGYKRIVNPNWVEVERNIWKLSLIDDNFSGIVIAGPSLSNNICAFHDYENDMIHGRKVWHKEEMISDWDFWQTEVLKNADPEDYNYVYLYLSSDPNQKQLERFAPAGILHSRIQRLQRWVLRQPVQRCSPSAGS